jgi:hypothetical protein
MSEREHARDRLAVRDAAQRLDGWYSPRIIRGAIVDAGSVGGYASVDDYHLAVETFARRRALHGRGANRLRRGVN